MFPSKKFEVCLVIFVTTLGSLEKTGTQEGLEDLGLAASSEPSDEAIINTGDDGQFNLNTVSITGNGKMKKTPTRPQNSRHILRLVTKMISMLQEKI